MRILTALLGSLLLAHGALAGVSDPRNLTPEGLALAGYDPVEYVDYQLALKGFHDIELVHEGARYRFRSRENRDRFAAEPDRYLPAYGGWCAYGFALEDDGSGYPRGRYPVDPERFKLVEGRLHLFYNEDDLDALEAWNRDEARYRVVADREWARMSGE